MFSLALLAHDELSNETPWYAVSGVNAALHHTCASHHSFVILHSYLLCLAITIFPVQNLFFNNMPSAISPEPPVFPTWKRPAPTTVDLPWADISVIDISSFDEPGGKEKLAEQLRHAV